MGSEFKGRTVDTRDESGTQRVTGMVVGRKRGDCACETARSSEAARVACAIVCVILTCPVYACPVYVYVI